MSEEVVIEDVSPLKKTRPSVVVAFSGPGFIGNTALMYIARNKEYELKARVKSRLLPPTVLFMEGKPVHPFRVYSDPKDELLMVVCETLVPSESAWMVGEKLMEWLIERGAKDFLAIEAMPMPSQNPEPLVYGFSIPKRELLKFGARPLTEGGVSGLNAVLMGEALRREIPWTTLLVPTAHVSNIDYNASIAVINVLNKMYKLGVDVTPLVKSIEMRQKIAEQASVEQKRGFLSTLKKRTVDRRGI